jgi:hypothetical protein
MITDTLAPQYYENWYDVLATPSGAVTALLGHDTLVLTPAEALNLALHLLRAAAGGHTREDCLAWVEGFFAPHPPPQWCPSCGRSRYKPGDHNPTCPNAEEGE